MAYTEYTAPHSPPDASHSPPDASRSSPPAASPDAPVVLWGHGWGQDHQAFTELTSLIGHTYRHVLLDFPGFGHSPVPFDHPRDSWGSDTYADCVAAFIQDILPDAGPVIWVGHSFGARVGTQLAATHPGLVCAMVFIAGAGLKHRRGPIANLRLQLKIIQYKCGKWLLSIPWLGRLLTPVFSHRIRTAGSADYQTAGPMRSVLVRVVNEDLSAQARDVICPVLLVYGEDDRATPPQVAQDFHRYMRNSTLVILPEHDHYSVLTGGGAHQVALHMRDFIQRITK